MSVLAGSVGSAATLAGGVSGGGVQALPQTAVAPFVPGWYKLLSIFRQQEDDVRWAAERVPVACLRCGLPLRSAPEGSGVQLYCPAGDYQYP